MPDINTVRPDTSIYGGMPQNKLMMPAESMGGAIGVAQGLQNLQTSQFALNQKHLDSSLQLLGSIAADPTMENVTRASQIMHQMGIPDGVIAQGIQEFSKDPTPAGIRRTAINAIARHSDVTQQMQMGGAAPPVMIDNGQTLNPTIVRSGQAPGIAPAAGNRMQKYLSPESAASPVAGPPTPTGAPTTVPLGGYAERAGQAAPGTYTKTAPTPTSPAMPTALAPGEGEAKRAAGGGSGSSLAAARDQSANYQASVCIPDGG